MFALLELSTNTIIVASSCSSVHWTALMWGHHFSFSAGPSHTSLQCSCNSKYSCYSFTKILLLSFPHFRNYFPSCGHGRMLTFLRQQAKTAYHSYVYHLTLHQQEKPNELFEKAVIWYNLIQLCLFPKNALSRVDPNQWQALFSAVYPN